MSALDRSSEGLGFMTQRDFLRTTAASYDTVAQDYTDQFYDELDGFAIDRALIRAFAELVERNGGGPVLDVGCGPGRTTAYLDSLGVDVSGLDLSAEMVRLARRRHPRLRFEVGTVTDLPVPAEALGGLLAYYSLIHIPTEHVPSVLAGFHRALRPGAPVAIAFQVGDDILHRQDAYGHAVELVAYRRTPELLAELLYAAGFELDATTVQAPAGGQPTPQAFLIAHRTRDENHNP